MDNYNNNGYNNNDYNNNGADPYGQRNYDYNTGNYYDMSDVRNTSAIPRIMTGVFGYMFAGLFLTFIAAAAAVNIGGFMEVLYGTGLIWVLMILELGLVIGISAGINKISSSAALFLFLLYSAINGLSLSIIAFVYEPTSIMAAFLTTALTFGGMALYGAFTKRDLSRAGSILIMGLWGIIVASLINFVVFRSDAASFGISVIGLLIFVGLTAYDTWRIKQRLAFGGDAETLQKITIIGALSLYLDFINIFLKILRIMNKVRR